MYCSLKVKSRRNRTGIAILVHVSHQRRHIQVAGHPTVFYIALVLRHFAVKDVNIPPGWDKDLARSIVHFVQSWFETVSQWVVALDHGKYQVSEWK